MSAYIANAAGLLIEIAFGVIVVLFVLRMLAEAVRADFYNPLSQFLYRSTNPVLMPLRRIIPNFRRINIAALLIAWLAEFLKNLALYALIGFRGAIPGVMLLGLADLLDFFAVLYLVMIFVWALLSFVSLDARHPLIPLLGRLVEPVLRPLRKILPAPGGLDLSPALAILIILLLRLLIVTPLFDLGHQLSL
ncbi:MAG TPA: YggT family protein [Rhodanobacteraceae bacterium]|nr:YggT family protein [Rhodanobacteraceae bacterium]